jgi:hypothetical protein
MSILHNKHEYFSLLDMKALEATRRFLNKKPVTKLLLETVHELYKSSKLDNFEDKNYDAAYHNPITSDFEFYISRFLYHLSDLNNLNWKIHLRCQKNSCSPDIRIEKNGDTLFIFEIKVKAGWIQEIFSDRRYQHEVNRYKNKERKTHPNEKVKKIKEQLSKYSSAFNIVNDKVFVLITSLENVHRKKDQNADINTYKNTFIRNTGLPKENLIVLTNTIDKDMSRINSVEEVEASDSFEKVMSILIDNA